MIARVPAVRRGTAVAALIAVWILLGSARADAAFGSPDYTTCRGFLAPTVAVSKHVSVESTGPHTTAVRLSASFINDDHHRERYAAFEFWSKERGHDSRQKLAVEPIPADSTQRVVTRTAVASELDPNTEYVFQAAPGS